MTKDDARERVQRGAALLDVQRPGWFNQIDAGTLTLHDPCGCIVGQLVPAVRGYFGAFYSRLSALGLSCSQSDAADLGLVISEKDSRENRTIEYPHPMYRLLQDAWIEAIADRVIKQAQAVGAVDPVGEQVTGGPRA